MLFFCLCHLDGGGFGTQLPVLHIAREAIPCGRLFPRASDKRDCGQNWLYGKLKATNISKVTSPFDVHKGAVIQFLVWNGHMTVFGLMGVTIFQNLGNLVQ